MTDKDSNLQQNSLHEFFEYRDGKLFRKKIFSTRNDLLGKEVGYITSSGYKATKIQGTNYLVHRLIYIMFYGKCPETLDHADGNRLNNKIENLRPATSSQNGYNKKNYSSNKTGVKGVNFNKQCGKFSARCQVNKKQNWLGLFPSLQLAEEAVKQFRAKHHGDYANHG